MDAADANDNLSAGQFAPIVFQVDAGVDLAHALFRIDYTNPANPISVAPQIGGDFSDPYTFYTTVGDIRLWKKDAAAARNKATVKAGGDFVAPGVYTAADLGITAANLTITLYVEGVLSRKRADHLPSQPNGKSAPIYCHGCGAGDCVDPAPETLATWQDHALATAGINPANWDPGQGFARQRTIVQRGYQFYQDLYDWSVANLGESYFWPGMGRN